MKSVIGLSGGMDSATLLWKLLLLGDEVHACLFTYGAKHNRYENQAAENLIAEAVSRGLSVVQHEFDLMDVMKEFKSALLLTGGDIPEGDYNDESMKKTVVPGRNLIFASIMAGLAESLEADTIALGVHSGDHHIYPDCRPEFIRALDLAVFLSSDRMVTVRTPFEDYDKKAILEIGFQIGVPYYLTRTCYKNQNLSCGKCGSCTERLEAFKLLGIDDPIEYTDF